MGAILAAIAIFIGLFFYERRAFKNVIFLGFIIVAIVLYFFSQNEFLLTENNYVTGYLFAFLFFMIPSIFLLLSFSMFFSSKILLEKEGRKLRNLLLPSLSVIVLAFTFGYAYFISIGTPNNAVTIIAVYCMSIFFYFAFLYTSTVAYSVLYNMAPIFYTPDFIIVLGSGLIGDRVPPLLASRLNKAADLYLKYDKKPRIITSGGQGADELVSESYAMRKYLIEHRSIKPDAVLMEDQSVNTLQNMQYSKHMMDKLKPNAKAIFVTNEFHLLRASFYARKAKINGDGIGSKTAFYYVPNAFTREFIALLVLYKNWHLAVLTIITLFFGLLFKSYM